MYFIGRSETHRYRNLENKNLKNATYCQILTAVYPAKRGTKQTQIELAMLDFRTEHWQLNRPTRLIGGFLYLCPGPPFTSHFAVGFQSIISYSRVAIKTFLLLFLSSGQPMISVFLLCPTLTFSPKV